MESLRVGLGGAVQPVSQQISIRKITLGEKVKGLDFPPGAPGTHGGRGWALPPGAQVSPRRLWPWQKYIMDDSRR